MAEPTSYERLGGIFAIAAVVNNFSGYGVVTGGGQRGQTVQPAPMAIEQADLRRASRLYPGPLPDCKQMVAAMNFDNLVAVLAVAAAVPLILAAVPRVPIPGPVLEIVAGIVLGPGGTEPGET